METKKCKHCLDMKTVENFHKDKGMKDGYKNYCKACYKAKIYSYGEKEGTEKRKYYSYVKGEGSYKNNYVKKGRNPKQLPKPIIIKGEIEGKECKRCGEWQPLTNYHKFKRQAYGLDIYCKPCNRSVKKQYFQTIEGRNNSSRASQKRRALLKNSKYIPFERVDILRRDKYTCQFCGIKVHDRSTGNWNTPNKAHLDHIVPLSQGGETRAENLQTLCRSCNLEKGANIKGIMRPTLF